MSKFWIDFQGYCCVDANSKEEAEEIFWDNMDSITPSDNHLYDITYQVDTVEKEEVSES